MRTFFLAILTLTVACGDDASMPDAALDAGSDADTAPPSCGADTDCDDGVFCNGEERCSPSDPSADADGCVDATSEPCLVGQMCDEAQGRCLTLCDTAGDADGDGHDALECDGDDCDDSDAMRFPGNAEVCDPSAVDEDCNPATFGTTDADGDGYVSDECCNMDADGTPVCGDDCNDAEPASHPTEAEMCDRIDNDCNGSVDEGLALVERYVDADGDGEAGSPVMHCEGDPRSVAVSTDCDETNVDIHQGAPELCDGIDNDCSLPGTAAGGADAAEDADGDGFAPLTATCTGGAFPVTDCDDLALSVNPGAPEVCDEVDNNCDTVVDEEPLASASCGATSTAVEACSSGSCAIVSCAEGTGNCGSPASDCTTDLATDGDHCGGCGFDCGAGGCVDGLCDVVTQVALGVGHGCTLRNSGLVHCWGSNTYGQLGDGSVSSKNDPVLVVGLNDATQLALGLQHSCALRSTGEVVCWGANTLGQLGDDMGPNRRQPGAVVVGLTDAVEIASGRDHLCGRRAGGEVVCWGSGASGQLGDGMGASSPVPVTVSGLAGAEAISAADVHTCAISGGAVYCWGSDQYGQLGDDASLADQMSPVAVSGIGTATTIATGSRHSCAGLVGGNVLCWGDNGDGRLGDGMFNGPEPLPVTVDLSNLTGTVTSVQRAAGLDHTCALLDDATLGCWGRNDSGQLGDGTNVGKLVPVPIGGVANVSYLAVGNAKTCVVHSGGLVDCWGNGPLGDGGTSGSNVPARSIGASKPVFEIEGGGEHACARNGAGRVLCWGTNAAGQLGDGTTNPHYAPTEVPGLADVREIAVGGEFTCAVVLDGTVSCWGQNDVGQLGQGDGGTTPSADPLPVPGLSSIVEVAAGRQFACARSGSGDVSCWGSDVWGQLGDGTAGGSRDVPMPVSGAAGAVELSLGAEHACARIADGTVECWGSGASGRLGNGSTARATSPTPVVALFDAVQIAVGERHTCALRATGELACWGDNSYGQLGDGSGAMQLAPVAVPGLSSVTVVRAGDRHTCAIRDGGSTYCWGENDPNGQLGDGTTMNRAVPTAVDGTGFVRMGLGAFFSFAVHADGSVHAWGNNFFGELGIGGSGTPELLPVAIPGLP